jgi:hypothetical protein
MFILFFVIVLNTYIPDIAPTVEVYEYFVFKLFDKLYFICLILFNKQL